MRPSTANPKVPLEPGLFTRFKPVRSLYRNTLATISILIVVAAAILVIGVATDSTGVLIVSAAMALAALLVWLSANLYGDDTTDGDGS